MKILIVSDTHSVDNNFLKVLEQVGPIDMLIHAGDTSGTDDFIKAQVSCPVKMVLGNNDYVESLHEEEEFEVEGYRFFLTHGHKYRVYFGTDRLIYRASELGADVVVYGHTHEPSIEYDEDLNIWVINPGSLTYPRQAGHKPSYVLCEIDRFGEIHFTLNFLLT